MQITLVKAAELTSQPDERAEIYLKVNLSMEAFYKPSCSTEGVVRYDRKPLQTEHETLHKVQERPNSGLTDGGKQLKSLPFCENSSESMLLLEEMTESFMTLVHANTRVFLPLAGICC